uniref:Transmembrane protein 208 n=1 Tax=Strongyloides stercoralis TaxID=6248 RepID=A0A0K0E7F9_STRER
MNTTGKGKKLTKGQKQIYDENMSTIRTYTIISYVTVIIYILAAYFLTSPSTWEWVGFGCAFLIQNIVIGLMCISAKAKKNEKGVVVDAGSDLNDPEGFGEYLLDAVILSSACHILGSIYSKFYLLLLIIPFYIIYKGVATFLIPWLTAGSDVPPEEDGGKGKKKQQEKIKYKRY